MKAEELREKIIEVLSIEETGYGQYANSILSLIKQGMLEVIGEDESRHKGYVVTSCFPDNKSIQIMARNELRAKQRSNLLQMMEGKKI